MTLRKPLLVVVAVLLGSALGVMPALAGTETAPTVNAVNSGLYSHYWSPSSASIEPGGTVTFNNATTVGHGIEWISPPATPSCEPSVPVGTSAIASGAEWKGTCTFAAAGTYRFYCTVHGAAMSGTITVGAGGTTTVTSTGTSTPTGGGATSTGTATPPAAGAPYGAPSAPGAGSTPLFSALHLGAAAHGPVVRGSLLVAPSSAGGTLSVRVLAARGQLASNHALVVLARFVRRSLHPGSVSFSVRLSGRGRAALRRHGTLRVEVGITLSPPRGTPAVTNRALTLRR